MPRLLIKTTGVFKNDQHMYKSAEAIEAGTLAYVTATDYFGIQQPLTARCIMAGVLWYFYSDYVDGLP